MITTTDVQVCSPILPPDSPRLSLCYWSSHLLALFPPPLPAATGRYLFFLPLPRAPSAICHYHFFVMPVCYWIYPVFSAWNLDIAFILVACCLDSFALFIPCSSHLVLSTCLLLLHLSSSCWCLNTKYDILSVLAEGPIEWCGLTFY